MTNAAPLAIRLNGQDTEVPAGTTLAALVSALGKNPQAVAIERNGDIVPRARFTDVTVEAGDALEVVMFVQGG
jgi:thiamine biosynthesis protein ThiS